MKIAAIIPAYNEAKMISGIIQRISKYVDCAIVVDNNSVNHTSEIAEKSGALVFKQEIVGQGASTRIGWNKVKWEGKYDTILTLDGDGQHNPDEAQILIDAMKETKADIIVGSRFLREYKAPRYRKFGIDVITWLFNVGHKRKLNDSQSCFRMYNSTAIRSLCIEDNGFGFSTELLIKARKLGLKMIEVPITCIYHPDRKMNSTLNPIKHGLGVAWKTIYWRIKLKN